MLSEQIVSAIAVDPSGARIATGSHDYDTKIWDFGGMDSRLKPFKSFEANGNYHVRLCRSYDADEQVHDIDYSLDGQTMLVISGTLYPKIFNKEGEDELVQQNGRDFRLR